MRYHSRRRCDDFWLRDAAVLVRRWHEFFPNNRQTDAERVNAAVRLMLFVSLAIWLYNRDMRYLAIALAGIALASVAYEMRQQRKKGAKTKQRCKTRSRSKPRSKPRCKPCAKPRRAKPRALTRAPRSACHSAPPAETRGDGGQVHTAETFGEECRGSTPDNPFANYLVTDDPDRPPACTYESMEDDVRANFNRGLFRNAYDVYERENSQRQFTTMPVTTAAADVQSFAEFCFATPPGRTKQEFLAARDF